MDGGTRLVNHSSHQPGESFFHYPKMPSFMKQQFQKPYRPPRRFQNQEPYTPMAQRDYSNYDAQKPRSTMRRAVDYSSSVIRRLEARIWQRDERDQTWIQPDPSYVHTLPPPSAFPKNPSNTVTTKFVHCSTNKVRCPVFCVVWTPEGRRLVTGASSGEFTLWNGLTFNFETILQAHDYPIRTMCWSHNDLWLLSGDDLGYVKYWQSNMNNVQMFQAHKDQAIRGVSFSPTDSKFASCSDDGTVRVWDFLRCHEERIMRGHGSDVRCVDWHQQKGLLVSGSKDSQQPVKLWDPRSGNPLTTIHAHKGTVMAAKFSINGNWLVTASRDHLCKLFDIRVMKEMCTFRGHKKEATSLALHPVHEDLFVSGGSDGSILFWQVGNEREVGGIEQAHDSMVWGLSWHPLGHMLCSGSNDHSTKFWSRNRPGDKMRDRYNLNTLPIGTSEELREYDDDSAVTAVIPGMGLDTSQPLDTFSKEAEKDSVGIPGLDSSVEEFAQITPVPQRKVPFSRPVPSEFQKTWEAKKAPGIAPNLEEEERLKKEKEEEEKKKQEKQRQEEEKKRREIERDMRRKREEELKAQKEKEARKKEADMRAEEEAMNQGPVIPGFGPDDGPPSRFPMPGPPPDISYGRERSPERPDEFMEDHMGPLAFAGNKGPRQIRGGRDRDMEREDFDARIKERDDHFDHEMDHQRHSRMDDLPPFGRGPGGPRHPGMGGQMHHDIDDSRHPERDGPRHRDIDGPERRDLDGPRRHDIDGPRHRDMDGPRRSDMDGPRHRDMDGPRRRDIDGPERRDLDGPRRPDIDGPRRPDIDGPRHRDMDGPRHRDLDGTRHRDKDGPRHSDVDGPREFEMDGARFRGTDGPPPDRPGPQRGGPPKKSSGPVPLMSLVLDPVEPPPPRPSRESKPPPATRQHPSQSGKINKPPPPPSQPKRAPTPPPPNEGPKPLIPGLTPEALRRGDISLDTLDLGPGPRNLPSSHLKKNEMGRGDSSERDFDRVYQEDVDYRQPPRGGPPKGGPMADRGSSDRHGPSFSSEHSNSPAGFNRSGPSTREAAPPGRGRGGLAGPSLSRGRGGARQGPDRFTSQGGLHGTKFDSQDDDHIIKDFDMRVPHSGGQSQDKDLRQTSGSLRNQNSRGGYRSSLERQPGNIMGKSSFDQTLGNRDDQMEKQDFSRDDDFQDRGFAQSKSSVSPRSAAGLAFQKDELGDPKEFPPLSRPQKRPWSEDHGSVQPLLSSNPMRGASGGRGRGQRGRGGARGGGARARGGRSRGRGRGRGGW